MRENTKEDIEKVKKVKDQFKDKCQKLQAEIQTLKQKESELTANKSGATEST